MGIIYGITCRNKECRYHVEVREGEGMIGFSRERMMEQELIEDESTAPQLKELLNCGRHLHFKGCYLCSNCKEWMNVSEPYILEPVHVSPYGTIREYKLHYLTDKPKCEKCNTELIYILNPKSGKNKCPKCGMDKMIIKERGFFD